MKRYRELTPPEKRRARDACLAEMVEEALDGVMLFDDAELQAVVNGAQLVHDKRTGADIVLRAAGKQLDVMALHAVRDAWYTEPDDFVIEGVFDD